jgi:hypothetical protein
MLQLRREGPMEPVSQPRRQSGRVAWVSSVALARFCATQTGRGARFVAKSGLALAESRG